MRFRRFNQQRQGRGQLGARPNNSGLPSRGHLISLLGRDIREGGDLMPAMTIRNISEETHRALKALAAAHGRSAEAEVRAILEQAVFPAVRIRLGSLLQEIGVAAGGVDLDIERRQVAREPLDLQ